MRNRSDPLERGVGGWEGSLQWRKTKRIGGWWWICEETELNRCLVVRGLDWLKAS